MRNPWILCAGLLGAAGVVLGAAGSHIAAAKGADMRLHEMAVSYQFYQVIGLIGCTYALRAAPKIATLAGVLMTIGIICFSGSLYYLSWTGDVMLRFITPFGGILMIIGWAVLLLAGIYVWKDSAER